MLRRSWLLLCVPPLSSVYGKNFIVSPRAWKRIREKNAEEGYSNNSRYLRLAIDSGGCHGYSYKFSLEENSTLVPEEDIVISESDTISTTTVNNNNNNNNNSESKEKENKQNETLPQDSPPRVVVDKHSVSKLQAAIIDFHSELKGSAFVVVGNELVDQTCACAMSFSIKKPKQKEQQR